MKLVHPFRWFSVILLLVAGFAIWPRMAQPQLTTIQPLTDIFGGEAMIPANGPNPEEPLTALARGYYEFSTTDLTLPGPIPLVLTRTYRSQEVDGAGNTITFDFGVGMTSNYDLQLFSQSYVNNGNYTNMQIVMPDGAQFNCARTSSCSKNNCTDYTDAVFQCTNNPGSFFAAVVSYNSSEPGWNVRRKDGETFYFPNGAALASITDRYGNQVNVVRNSSGNPTEITDTDGRYINLYYTESSNPGQITQAVDSAGRTVIYAYNSDAQMTSFYNADGAWTTFDWTGTKADMTGIVEYQVAATGAISYSSVHRLTSTTGVLGNYSYQYPSGMQGNGPAAWAKITDPRNYVRELNFNGNDYITEDTQAEGEPEQQVTQYVVDANTSEVTSVTDQLGRTTTYVYGSYGNILSITQLSGTPQAATTSYTYDPSFSQLTSVTDPLGHKTSISIDGYGNATTRTDPLGNTVRATYNSAGQMLTLTDALQNTTSFAYDSSRDLQMVTDPLSAVFTLGYDTVGRLTSVEDALQKTSSFVYDAMNRVTKMTDATGAVTQLAYDPLGNLVTVTDANGHQLIYSRNYQYNTVQRCDGANRCETADMDPLGNVTSITDGRSLTDQFTYDGLSRLITAQYNTSKTAGYNQTQTAYVYDGGNRLTSAHDSGTGSAGDTLTATYDGLDDPLTTSYVSATLNAGVSYTYDLAQRRQTMTASNQAQTAYSYDNDDNLISETRGTQAVGFVYDADGRPETITQPNSVTISYGYDADSHPTSINYSSTGGGNLGNLTYGYDQDGRVNSFGGTLATVNMPYAMTATYDAGNQLATWNTTPATTDGNGNLTFDPSLSATYAWNERNQLASTTSGVQSSFTYDAEGRRVGLLNNGATTQYVYDGLNVAQQETSGGTVDMIPGLNLDGYFSLSESGQIYAMLAEAPGSVAGLVNSSGAFAVQYQYGPYGASPAMGGPTVANPFQYLGRESDPSGLYDLRARYYNPLLGRFLSPDPIGFVGGQANLFAYSFDSPTNFSDPLGLFSAGCGGGGGGGGGPAPPSGQFGMKGKGNGKGGGSFTIGGGLTFSLYVSSELMAQRNVSLYGLGGLAQYGGLPVNLDTADITTPTPQTTQRLVVGSMPTALGSGNPCTNTCGSPEDTLTLSSGSFCSWFGGGSWPCVPVAPSP